MCLRTRSLTAPEADGARRLWYDSVYEPSSKAPQLRRIPLGGTQPPVARGKRR